MQTLLGGGSSGGGSSGGGFPNGTEWTKANIAASRVHCVQYADGLWVAGTNSGMHYSEDGVNWDVSNLSETHHEGVMYANSIWVAGSGSPNDTSSIAHSGLYYSEDGKNWTQSNIVKGAFAHITYHSGVWVAYGRRSGLYYSTDGKTWNTTTGYTSSTGNTARYIGVLDGDFLVSIASATYRSSDGITWALAETFPEKMSALICGGGMYICGASNGLYYSLDGLTWTQSNITSCSYPPAIKFADGVFVAACPSPHSVQYSVDGKTWNATSVSGTTSFVDNSAGVWVAGGITAGKYYSVDGRNWTKSLSGEAYVDRVNASNGMWHVFGASGLYYSVTWKHTT